MVKNQNAIAPKHLPTGLLKKSESLKTCEKLNEIIYIKSVNTYILNIYNFLSK